MGLCPTLLSVILVLSLEVARVVDSILTPLAQVTASTAVQIRIIIVICLIRIREVVEVIVIVGIRVHLQWRPFGALPPIPLLRPCLAFKLAVEPFNYLAQLFVFCRARIIQIVARTLKPHLFALILCGFGALLLLI